MQNILKKLKAGPFRDIEKFSKKSRPVPKKLKGGLWFGFVCYVKKKEKNKRGPFALRKKGRCKSRGFFTSQKAPTENENIYIQKLHLFRKMINQYYPVDSMSFEIDKTLQTN